MTIKIELPAGDMAAARVFGEALTRLANGSPYADKQPVGEQCKGPGVCDDQGCPAYYADEQPQIAGPFYWVHHESESYGIEETPEDLGRVMGADPLVEQVSEVAFNQITAQWQAKESKQEAPAASDESAEVDEKGVAFNREFCAKAAQPFYGSGKKKGQWKKRQGVDEDEYDEWYAGELLADKIEDAPQTNHAANTFGKKQEQPQSDAPQSLGDLMTWVSEQQTAGRIEINDLNSAYADLRLPMDALINPEHPVQENIAAVYEYLSERLK